MSHRVLFAAFEHEDDLLAAAAAVRQKGLRIVDAFTPYAVHGLDRAMGLKPSRLTWVCFVCGMTGALGMLCVRTLGRLGCMGHQRWWQALELAAIRCPGRIRSGRAAGRIRIGVRLVCRKPSVSRKTGSEHLSGNHG